jgi:adenylosuccinate lyase
MAKLWSDRSRYRRWLTVELAVATQQMREGILPKKDFKRLEAGIHLIQREGGIEPDRVEEIEQVTRHDVIAFTTAVTERLGAEGRWLHFGLTSSDIVDTALSITLVDAGKKLIEGASHLESSLRKRAKEFKGQACLGRTHGMAAEPTSFGLKFLGWAQEIKRGRERLESAVEGVRYGKLSGAVGCNSVLSPAFEESCLKSLGLKREPVSTQVIPRDRHAQFVQTLALVGAGLERIAVELRHLQRSEVSELREGFRRGQKGSSAMPHKRNPISSENITGCARVLRSHASAALENVALWHERDISHSSVERIILPDSTLLLDYAIHRMTGIIDNLEVDRDRMSANLTAQGGVTGSGHVLLALVEKGVSREEAYIWVQSAAHAAMDQALSSGVAKNDSPDREAGVLAHLVADKRITAHLSSKELARLVSMEFQLRSVDGIFKRSGRPRASFKGT